MKLLLLYSCLLSVLLQAISASSLDGIGATLTSKGQDRPKKVKKAVGKPVKKKKSSGAKKPAKKGAGKNKEIVVKEDKPKSLSAILPKVLVEMVIGYLSDTYSILVYTHDWLLKSEPQIAVDEARLYVMTSSEGLKGLNHSSASLKEDERRYIEFDSPPQSNHAWFTSSYDGRYVCFNYNYKAATDRGEQTKFGTKWLTQGSDLEDGNFKPVKFGRKRLVNGLLSRDGQTLFSLRSGSMCPMVGVYQIKKKATKGLVAFRKFELMGTLHAVSASGNRIMVEFVDHLEVRDVGKGAGNLVCQVNNCPHACALNEDGTEAAFAKDSELQVVDVNKFAADKSDPSAIVTVKAPKSLGAISDLVYSDENKLHVLHFEGRVSLFDPLEKALIPIEVPQERRSVKLAISPNADYIATLQYVREEEKSGTSVYRAMVKRKLIYTDLSDLFESKIGKEAVQQSQADLNQHRS